MSFQPSPDPLAIVLRDALAPAHAFALALGGLEPPPVPGVGGATSATRPVRVPADPAEYARGWRAGYAMRAGSPGRTFDGGHGRYLARIASHRDSRAYHLGWARGIRPQAPPRVVLDAPCPEPAGSWTRVERAPWSCQYCGGASESRRGPCDLCQDRGIPDEHHEHARRAVIAAQNAGRIGAPFQPRDRSSRAGRACLHATRDSDGACPLCGQRDDTHRTFTLPPVLTSWTGEHPEQPDPAASILDRAAGTLAQLAADQRAQARSYTAQADTAGLAGDLDSARLFRQLASSASCRAFALDHAHAVVTLAPDHPTDDFDQLAMRAALLAVEHPSR